MKLQKIPIKILSCFLVVCVVMLSTWISQSLKTTADGAIEIWDGTMISSRNDFAGGNGTKANPYLIENGAQLKYALEMPASNGGQNGIGAENLHFKITKDIYLNDVSERNWHKKSNNNEWIDARNWTWGFTGYLNGDGHCVYGVWYPETNISNDAALIPIFNGGKIEKLGVRYSRVYAKLFAGGLVGRAIGKNTMKEIDQCFADETVSAKFTAKAGVDPDINGGAAGIVGGIINIKPNNGSNSYLSITNTYSKAALSSNTGNENRMRGILATAWDSAWVIADCYSIGFAPYFASNANGEFSRVANAKDLFINNYSDIAARFTDFEKWTQILNPAALYGKNAASVLPKLDFENIFMAVEKGTPILQAFKNNITGDEVDTSEEGELFDGGTGRISDPYIITNVEQLRYVAESKNTAGKYYALGNDININDTSDPDWKDKNPVEWINQTDRSVAFAGSLDGNGHYIRGLYLNETPEEYVDGDSIKPGGAGLFPNVKSSASVRNVHIRDSFISGKYYAGAIAGYQIDGEGRTDYMMIVGCSADKTVTIHGQTAGGLIGGGPRGVAIYYSYFTGNLKSTAPNLANALIGDMWISTNVTRECYSIGHTSYSPGHTPITTEAVYGTVEQTGVTVVKEADMIGEKAKTTMPGFSWGRYWDVKDGELPHPKYIPSNFTEDFYGEGEVGAIWSGRVATSYAGGSGTKNDPYLIETAEQLAYLVTTFGADETYFLLTQDIRLNDTSIPDWEKSAKSWYGDAYWGQNMGLRGHFDGGGHVVSGLYYNGSASCAALFPGMGKNSSIKNIGVTESTIITTGEYAAPIVGMWRTWYTNETGARPGEHISYVSQCFADNSVYVKAGFGAGGIVGGGASPIHIDNCYFTGTVIGDKYSGGLWGDCWSAGRAEIYNCYVQTEDGDPPLVNGGIVNSDIQGMYVVGEKDGGNKAIVVTTYGLLGDNAKKALVGFDFDTIWKTVEGGSPVLRVFGENAEKYSSRREPTKTKISFLSDGGSYCEPIYGYALFEKVPKLPTPTRYGYEFGGWFLFMELDYPFNLETFPTYDITLYPKWIPTGATVNFEGVVDSTYDLNYSTELFRPGVLGYDNMYVHGGMRAIHCLDTTPYKPMFLVSYEYTMQPGKEYTLSFWMTTDKENTSGQIELVHSNYADVYDETFGYQVATQFTGLKVGEWKQYTVTFVAGAPYVLIRTPENASLFFDDMLLAPTGKSGKYIGLRDNYIPPVSNNQGSNNNDYDDNDSNYTDDNTTNNNTNNGNSGSSGGKKKVVKKIIVYPGYDYLPIIIGSIAGGVILLAAIITIIIIVKKSRKNTIA